MPRQKNTILRLLIPLIALLAGLGIAILAAQNAGTKSPSNTKTAPETPLATNATIGDDTSGTLVDDAIVESQTNQPDPPTTAQTEPATEPAVEPATPQTPASQSAAALRVRIRETAPTMPTLGSLDPDSDAEMQAEISPLGLGIESLRLADYFETIDKKDHILIQSTHGSDTGQGVIGTAVPFALTAVIVNGQRLDLTSGPNEEPIWANAPGAAPGAFTAIIEDESGTPIVRIQRTLSIKDNSHIIEARQRAENLSDNPVTLVWVNSGPVTPDPDTGGYGGDKRRARFGYWLKPTSQAGDTAVLSNKYTKPFSSLAGVIKNGDAYNLPSAVDIWPNPKSLEDGDRLVWFGVTDRYFGVALHPLIEPADPERLFKVQRLTRIAGLKPGTPMNAGRADLVAATVVLTLVKSEPVRIEPTESTSFNLGLFAGPLSRPIIDAEPLPKALGLDGLVLYNFGGMCAFCTFQPLARLLLAILHFLHGITGDWAIGIILLVIMVRTCLHPVSRWSQIKMQRFGVQMQAMAPKQKKIKEKFGDDPKRMQQEMTKLWREEGVNPAGMLGCLPMLLQSPVWIALYATLFFAVELRHEPAFYGVFQSVFSGWQFLGDLSRSDNAIPLGKTFNFGFFHIDAINVLPILMGFVFFFHQKYLTPPTTTSMTPEQESTQKMVKILSVFMFPVFMYAAPSGLALYFVTNSSLAIIENKWIRAHMNKHGMLDPDKLREHAQAKREAKATSGFMARLKQAAEQQQQQQAASKRMMRRVKNVAPDKTEPNYKKKKPKR